MYWPSPEESDNSHCDNRSSSGNTNGAGRGNGDRRTVYQSMSPLLNTTDCELMEPCARQRSTLDHSSEVAGDRIKQQWRSLSGEEVQRSTTQSCDTDNTAYDVNGCFVVGYCRRDSASSPE